MLAIELFKKFLLSKKAGSIVRLISRLTLISVSVSVAALLVVMSVMNALNKNIRDRTLSVEPHLYIEMTSDSPLKMLEMHPAIARVKEDPNNIVYFSEYQDVILRTQDGKFRGATARGLDPQGLKFVFDQMVQVRNRQLGRHMQLELELGPNEIILGRDLAGLLGVIEGDMLTVVPPEGLLLPVGETPRIDKVKVRKILSTDIADVDAQTMFFYRGQTLLNLKGEKSRKIAAEVWLKDPFDAFDMQKKLSTFSGVRVLTWQERNSAIFQSLRLEKMVVGLFLSLASLIAALSVVSVMGLLVQQKKKEIGLIQVLGLSRKQTQNLFLKLGFILGSLGLVIGVIGGGAVSLYLEKFPLRVLPDIYYDSAIPALVNPPFFAWVFVVGLLVSLISAFISVRPVLEVEPAQTLK